MVRDDDNTIRRHWRGATSSTVINPDHGDPEYAYRPLSYHANRAIADATDERQAVAQVRRQAA